MSTWLITSFGLPVALTAGRLTAATLSGLPPHLVAVAITLGGAMTTSLLVARRRRRRASPGASSF
jgi:hypothetical protein